MELGTLQQPQAKQGHNTDRLKNGSEDNGSFC